MANPTHLLNLTDFKANLDSNLSIQLSDLIDVEEGSVSSRIEYYNERKIKVHHSNPLLESKGSGDSSKLIWFLSYDYEDFYSVDLCNFKPEKHIS